jgi:hypothetical protein
MPIHSFRCPTGHVFDAYQSVDKLDSTMACDQCKAMADKVFLKAPAAFVRQDVHYESPVDGRPIQSWQQHQEELARTDSVVYEPGIKQDQERNQRMREQALEQSIEATVEREVATMPTRKKEKLAAELDGGLTVEPTRL